MSRAPYQTNAPYGLPSAPRPYAAVGLPSTPRAQRQMLYPINTNVRYDSANTSANSEKPRPMFIDTRQRNAESMIFVNATIPLSPASVETDNTQHPFDGLVPRKRNAFARLFCCFGTQERARRRHDRHTEYEKVGGPLHWTEL